MRVLAVVAHPDDELFGCGATLRKLANAGHEIVTCVLSGNAEARSNRPELERLRSVAARAQEITGIKRSVFHEFRNIEFNVVPHLEMVRAIEEVIADVQPEWVFTHHPGDLNVDHRICYETTATAVMLPQRLSRSLPPLLIKRVYLFEIPSATDWALPPAGGFHPNSFVDVTETLETKLAALRAFEGALKPHPHSRSEDNVKALARVRGAAIGVEFAEAFSLVRDVHV